MRRSFLQLIWSKCMATHSSGSSKEPPFVHISDGVLGHGRGVIIGSTSNNEMLPSHFVQKIAETGSKVKATSRRVSAAYILDRNVSEVIARKVVSNHDPTKLLIEINPGVGCLTAEIVNSGCSNVHLVESNTAFLEYLKLYKSFLSDVTVSNEKFFLPVDFVNNSPILSSGLSIDWPWRSDPQASIVCIINDLQQRLILPWLISIIASCYQYGRLQFFLTMPDRAYWRLSEQTILKRVNMKFYTPNYILAQILFEFHLLHRLPKTQFVPNVKTSTSERKVPKEFEVGQAFDPSLMALVLVKPRAEVASFFNLSEIRIFSGFVRYLLAKRSAAVIPMCERIIPGIGLRILQLPFCKSIAVRTGDLSPADFVSIYKVLRASDEFSPESIVPWPPLPAHLRGAKSDSTSIASQQSSTKETAILEVDDDEGDSF